MKTVREAINEINKELEHLSLGCGSAAHVIIKKAFEIPGVNFKLEPKDGYTITAPVVIEYVPTEFNTLYDNRFRQLKIPVLTLCPKKKRCKNGRFYLKEFEYWGGSILAEGDDIAMVGSKIDGPGQKIGLFAQTRNLKHALRIHELALNEDATTHKLIEMGRSLADLRRFSMGLDYSDLTDAQELPLLIERAEEIQSFRAKNGMSFDEPLDELVTRIRKAMSGSPEFENCESTIKLKKVLDSFVTGPYNKKTNTRFVRLESDKLDYKICISFHKTGYINISVRGKNSPIQCGGTMFQMPEILIQENENCEPAFAEVHMLGERICEVDIPDYTAFLQRVQKNLHVINGVIKTVNAGERFTNEEVTIC